MSFHIYFEKGHGASKIQNVINLLTVYLTVAEVRVASWSGQKKRERGGKTTRSPLYFYRSFRGRNFRLNLCTGLEINIITSLTLADQTAV